MAFGHQTRVLSMLADMTTGDYTYFLLINSALPTWDNYVSMTRLPFARETLVPATSFWA